MKMYILVKKSVPRGLGANGIGHAVLSAYLQFKDHPDTIEWLDKSFRKVTCLVNDAEFEIAKKTDDHVIITESDYNNEEIAIAFRPRTDWPDEFRKLKLFK